MLYCMCCFVCDCLSYLAQNGAKRGDLGLMGAICYLILYYNYKSILKIFIRVDTFFTRPESIGAIWGYGANLTTNGTRGTLLTKQF